MLSFFLLHLSVRNRLYIWRCTSGYVRPKVINWVRERPWRSSASIQKLQLSFVVNHSVDGRNYCNRVWLRSLALRALNIGTARRDAALKPSWILFSWDSGESKLFCYYFCVGYTRPGANDHLFTFLPFLNIFLCVVHHLWELRGTGLRLYSWIKDWVARLCCSAELGICVNFVDWEKGWGNVGLRVLCLILMLWVYMALCARNEQSLWLPFLI